MATTITSNEGLSSSTPPDQIPSFTPEAYAEEQSFEKDLLRPSIEAEKKYQEEGLKIRQENYQTIRKHARDFDKFEPTVSPEIKSRALVSGYIDSMFPENDRPSNDHDILRDSIAKQKFNGAGVGNDEAFLEAMRGDFDREDEEQGFWDDLDRRATLSAMVGGGQPLNDFKEWVWSDENSEFTKANRLEINDRWQKNQDAIREKFGVDMLHDLRTTFNDMGTEDQWLALAWRRTKDYSDEEKDLFIASLRDLATEYPSEAGNSFLANFGTSTRRGVMGALDKGAYAADEYFRNALDVAPHNVFVAPFAEVLGTEESKEWSLKKRKENEKEVKDWRKGIDWLAELRDTHEQDWDPVRGLAAKDTTLRAIEDGIYAIPGALTTSAVAFIPVVGMPLSFGMMKEFDREKYRREILSNGGSREDAYNLAGGMSMVSAVPNMLLEKFQSYGLTGKIPGMGKVFGKIDDIFANKLGRFGTKMFVAGAAETTVELTQQATTDLVQDITNSFKEFNPIVPDIEWKNGKDGHFDGYFNKTLTTFVAVAPLGVMVAGRGMTMESRAEALKTASPLERKAFGITEEASKALDEAKSPREVVEAFQNAVKTREPWSETAHESVMELERMHEMRSKTNEDSEKFGVSPAVRRTPDSPTFEVFDRTTGDTIAEVNTAQEATEEVFNQLQLKAEEQSKYFEELQTAFEAASLDVEQSGEAVEVGTGKHTDADVELASPEAGRRLQTEREIIEQRNGGTGEVAQEVMSEGDTSSRTVAGAYTPGDQMGRKEAVTRLYNGSSVLTLIHERGHAKRRKLMATGAWTRADQISSLVGLDNFITKADERFLPENFAELSEEKQEVALDEAVAELAEVLALNSRKGKNSKMGKLIKKSMSAMVQARVPGAAQLSSFIDTMGKFFGLQLRRATLLKKAVRDGKLDQAQVDKLTDMLVGEDSQEVFEQEREQIPVEMIDGQEVDVPFSPGRADMLADPIVEQIYLKETDKFKKGVEDGRIKTNSDIRDFIGKHMVMHQPDTAMAGEVRVDGESFVKGKGGVYYPVLFAEEGYFWASTAAKADEMAGALNEISERNGGSIYMALTSADVDKLFSSTTMSVGTMNFFKQLATNPRKYGITESQLNKMLIEASKTKIVSKLLIKGKDGKPVLNEKGEKTYKVKTQEFGHTLSKGTKLKQTMQELEGWLQPFSEDKSTGSSFDVRKSFVFDLMKLATTHLKSKPKQSKAVAALLTQESNEFAKNKVLKGDLSLAAFTQGLGDMLSEPLTKTFQQFGNKGKGYIYAVIEIEGKVKAIDTKGHESYPKAIVSAEGKLPTVHVMKEGYHWTDVVQEKDSGARVERVTKEMNKVYPTGGFSAYKGRPLQFGDVQAEAEGVELSFSPANADMLSNITPAQDAEYMELAQNPEQNRSALQKLVDQAARAAGYLVGPVYHGSKSSDIKAFDPGKHSFPRSLDAIGTWFTTEESQTKRYAFDATTYRQVLKMDNPLTFELKDVIPEMQAGQLRKLATRRAMLEDNSEGDSELSFQEQKESRKFAGEISKQIDELDAQTRENEPFYALVDTWRKFHGGEQFGDPQAFVNHLKSKGYDGIHLRNTLADFGREGSEYADWYIAFDSSQSKSTDPVTKDADGNVIPLSQRFDPSRGEIAFSPGDARMLSDLSENVMRRVRAPESRAVVFEQLIDRIAALKRDIAKMIFGGTVVQEAIPDQRSMKSLQKESAFRQAARHDELEMELDSEMRTLGADLAVSVKDMPVHSALIDGGYNLTTKKKALKEGRMQETDGDFDDVEGLHPSVFGGDTMPDVAAQALAGLQQDGQVILQEGTVSELYDALAQEWQQVQENRQMNKDAKKKLRDTGKQARAEANKWLDEAIAKQKKHYNPVARIRRSLVVYDAILKTLPPELRGKMGGFVQIGKLNSDKARLEFLEKKLDQLDIEVDKWISGKHRKQIDKIFEANKPKKKNNGPSKVNSDALYADQVIEIKAISEMTQEEVDAAIEDVDGDIEKKTEEWELEELVTRRDKLSVFGNIDGMKANALGDFYQNLNTIHQQGKLLKSITDAQFNAFLEETVDLVNEDVTGGQGQISQSEAKRLDEARKGKKINLKWIGAEDVELDGLADFHRKNLSFEWLLNAISRANKAVETMKSMTNQRLGTMVHLATTAADRGEMALTEEYREALASIFGVRAGGQRNVVPALENKISSLEKVGETNVFKMEYEGDGKSNTRTIPMSKVQAIIDNKATLDGLGLSNADWSAIKASHAELIKGRQAKENEKAEAAKRKPKKVTLTASTKITYESPVEGESKPMALSQSQGINLSMLWRQDGLKESMEHEGYSEKTMEQLEDFLTDESKEIRAWLTIKYDENYHKINKVFRAQNGFSLPKIDFYAPALRMANKEAKDMSIDSQGRQAMSVSPEFTITRTQNRAPMDQTAGALSIYMSHALQTNHYVSWADTVKVLRSVFANKDVRANIKGYVGVSALQTIEERIQWFADGGNRKATHIKLMDSLRAAHTYNSLSFKWSILVKQLTSLPAYAFDMGFRDFSKYGMKFLKHPIKNLRSMKNTEYVKTRFKKGYERDVIDGLNNRGKASVLRKMLQVGMMSGKVGDIIPVMIGGWIAREQAYDAARADGLSKADAQRKAEITFEMVSDRSQQAGGLKDLSSFQGGGSIFKLFTMFKTSPRQYYANVYESLLDADGVKGLVKGTGKKGSRAQFTRRFLISHVMLPVAFQFMSDITRMGLRPDDEDDFSWDSYFRAMLLGPLNGVFILGDAVDLIASAVAGTHMWEKVLPILGGPSEIARGIYDIGDGDFLEGIDDIARGIGKMTPSGLTFYDILTDEAKRLHIMD